MFNRVTQKLYYPPLIINMVSILLLFFIAEGDRMYAIYYCYLPVVITSIAMNAMIALYRFIDGRIASRKMLSVVEAPDRD